MDFDDIFLFLLLLSFVLCLFFSLFPSYLVFPFNKVSCRIALRLAYIVLRQSMVYHFIQSIYNCSRTLLIHFFLSYCLTSTVSLITLTHMKRANFGPELFSVMNISNLLQMMQFCLVSRYVPYAKAIGSDQTS